jgi:hypothetical protein
LASNPAANSAHIVVNIGSLPSTVILVTGADWRGVRGKGICPFAAIGLRRRTAAAHNAAVVDRRNWFVMSLAALPARAGRLLNRFYNL